MLYERHLFFASFDILYKCSWTKVVDIIVYLLPNTTARITIALRFEIRIETKINSTELKASIITIEPVLLLTLEYNTWVHVRVHCVTDGLDIRVHSSFYGNQIIVL